MSSMHHYGDPCIHCGIAHDEVSVGPCLGDEANAKPIAYAVVNRRFDGVEHYAVRMSTGAVKSIHAHASYRLPYYRFGHAETLVLPPSYDTRLAHAFTTGGRMYK